MIKDKEVMSDGYRKIWPIPNLLSLITDHTDILFILSKDPEFLKDMY